MAKQTSARPGGTLIAIGGHEDKKAEKVILSEVAAKIGRRRLVIATLASEQEDAMWDDYRTAFTDLGIKNLVHLKLEERLDARDDPRLRELEAAGGVFFTGGDQLRITSKLGGTVLCERMHELYMNGGVIAGTSAGASVLTETMIVSGEGRSHRIADTLMLAPGLGFLPAMVIDQHFAERGRLGRLLGVVGQNPRTLGIGIDENTAVIIEKDNYFRVAGAGAVYVVDGRPITYTNISDQDPNRTMSVYDVRLHLLSAGDWFDLGERRPKQATDSPSGD